MVNAVILLSGGLDSATCLALASKQNYKVYALSIYYGQRSRAEVHAATRLAQDYRCADHQIIQLPIHVFKRSALTDHQLTMPTQVHDHEIPTTYVPARNTIFLSFALAYAEVTESQHIFIGANQVDYANYPDCRDDYLHAFEHMANLATRNGREGKSVHIEAPLLHLSKADIIRLGLELGVDYSKTVTCYQADDHGHACGHCPSCHTRRQGFQAAGIIDPTRYSITEKNF